MILESPASCADQTSDYPQNYWSIHCQSWQGQETSRIIQQMALCDLTGTPSLFIISVALVVVECWSRFFCNLQFAEVFMSIRIHLQTMTYQMVSNHCFSAPICLYDIYWWIVNSYYIYLYVWARMVTQTWNVILTTLVAGLASNTHRLLRSIRTLTVYFVLPCCHTECENIIYLMRKYFSSVDIFVGWWHQIAGLFCII